MRELPRNGTAFQLRALGGGRAQRRAGSDPPLQISARALVRTVPADLFLREAVPALRGQDWDFIVPVPLHPVKQREREFNQAERLAAHLSAATRNPFERKIAPAGQAHRDPDPAHAAAARGEHARRFCRSPGRPVGRRTGDSGGRCFHHRRDHQRVRRGFAGRRGGRCLRLDSCPRTLVLYRQVNGHDHFHQKIARSGNGRAGLDPAAGQRRADQLCQKAQARRRANPKNATSRKGFGPNARSAKRWFSTRNWTKT